MVRKTFLLLLILAILFPLPAFAQDPDRGKEKEGGGIFGFVRQIFQHILVFPVQSMKEAIEKTFHEIFSAGIRSAFPGLHSLLLNTFNSMPRLKGGGTGIFAGTDIFRKTWLVTLQASLFFFPAILVFLFLFSAREALSGSEWGVANVVDAISTWGIGIILALSSFELMDLACRFSNALTRALNREFAGAGDPLSTLLVSLLPVSFPFSPGIIVIMVIVTVVGLVAFFALFASLVARWVLLLVFVALAPLALSFGSLPPLRWLRGLWLKGFVLIQLLGPINSILFGTGYLLFSFFFRGNPLWSFPRFIVALGIASLIITVNMTISKSVFGAVVAIGMEFLGFIRNIVLGIALGAGMGGIGGLIGISRMASGAEELAKAGDIQGARRAIQGIERMGIVGRLFGERGREVIEEERGKMVESLTSQAIEGALHGNIAGARGLIERARQIAWGNEGLMKKVEESGKMVEDIGEAFTGKPSIDKHIARGIELFREKYPGISPSSFKDYLAPLHYASAYKSLERMASEAGFTGADAGARFVAWHLEAGILPQPFYFQPDEKMGEVDERFPVPPSFSPELFGEKFGESFSYPDYYRGVRAAIALSLQPYTATMVEFFRDLRTAYGDKFADDIYRKAISLSSPEEFHNFLRDMASQNFLRGASMEAWEKISCQLGLGDLGVSKTFPIDFANWAKFFGGNKP
ncbi:MAG: hypothetical protein QXH03_00210 [Candidatus Bathyarchaeia archaeon]